MKKTSSKPTRYHRLTLVLAAAALGTAALAADPLAVRYYEDAVSRFNAGDAKGALIQLKNALQRDPGQLSAKILTGRTYLALGEPRLAEEELLQAQKLGADPLLVALPLARARNEMGKYDENIHDIVPIQFPRAQQPDLWVELGLARLYKHDPDGAQIAFEEALKIDPAHTGSRLGMARIPLEAKDFEGAERLADEVIAIDPQNAEAWVIKGSVAHVTGQFEEAATAYGRAYQINPQSLQAAFGEAAALMDGKKPAKAAALLRNLQQAHPYSPTIPYLLSKALTEIGRLDDAKLALGDAAAIVSQVTPADIANRPTDLLVYGTIAFDNGEFEQAYKFLNAYVQAGGADIRGRKMLGRVLISMGKPGDALRVLVRLSAGGNADAETLTLMGDANIQLNDFDAAERYFKEALTTGGGGPVVAQRLAMAQYRGGQRDKGLETMRELVDILPPEAGADTTLLLGFLYLGEGRLDEAEQMARSLLSRSPDDKTYRNFAATVLANQGQPEEARSIYSQLVAEDPAFRPARFNLIKLDISQGRYAEATRELNTILAMEPDNTEALYDSGRVARLKEDYREATQTLEHLRTLRPTWFKAAKELVSAYLALNNQAAALKTALDLYAQTPQSVKAHQLLASTQAAAGDVDDARETLKKASLLAGNDTQRLSNVGNQQLQLGVPEDATWTYTKAVALNPSAYNVRFNLATSLFQSGKLEEAEIEIGHLRQQNPDLVVTDILLADIRQKQGRLDEAIDLYQSAMRRQPRQEVVQSLYGALLRKQRPQEATAVLDSWLRDHPDSIMALNLLAEHHLSRNEYAAALPLYEKLVELDSDNPQTYNNLAVALGSIDGERALKAALEAYRLSPHNPFVLDTLGWSLVQIGELEKGLGHLREARARNGRSPTTRYHLGVALQEFGNYGEALNELRGALATGRDFAERSEAEARVRQLESRYRN
ncbi:MAG: PEP-CTERM system TPR-repeat protein PrsT [Chromatiaceae bacterium]|nr:PEP-CTERM system TPR-repeat protein PrsT [Chromatiaceae bacterium]